MKPTDLIVAKCPRCGSTYCGQRDRVYQVVLACCPRVLHDRGADWLIEDAMKKEVVA